MLLWFVAAYCVVDAVNMILMSALQGAGDTRWLLIGSGAMHLVYLLALLVIGWRGGGLYMFWGTAMVFIVLLSGVWLVRFRGGGWRGMRVIEQGVPELEAAMRE
ncbi:MAG: hypothetical protein IT442_03755 [Phycisphaeraceae bacterium]|nr:hypothetical protein [Phycisphaeraceae bacterium]